MSREESSINASEYNLNQLIRNRCCIKQKLIILEKFIQTITSLVSL